MPPRVTFEGATFWSIFGLWAIIFAPYMLEQRFPTWGTCTPRGTFAIRIKVSNTREIYSYISFDYKYLYIYQWILFSKAVICSFLNISLTNHDKIFVIRNFKGTCSSVEMLKGYMLVFRNAEGVHGQRKVGNRCARKSIKGSIDADFDLIFNKTLSPKHG